MLNMRREALAHYSHGPAIRQSLAYGEREGRLAFNKPFYFLSLLIAVTSTTVKMIYDGPGKRVGEYINAVLKKMPEIERK